jgi:hypothetical protein
MARPVKGTVDYFPHATSHGATLFILEERWGNDGYAFWFKLLEILGSKEGLHVDMQKPQNWRFLLAKTKQDEVSASEMLECLAELGAIDPDLWEMGVVFSQNFVDGVSDAFRRRKVFLPSKTSLLESFCRQKPAETDVSDGNVTEKTGKGKERKGKEREIKGKEKDRASSSELSQDSRSTEGQGDVKSQSSSSRREPYTQEFLAFWAEYPNKVGKKAAFNAWKRSAKERPPIEQILAAVRMQCDSAQWQKNGGQYIPNPATWINQGRWDDEVLDVKEERPMSHRERVNQDAYNGFMEMDIDLERFKGA